MNHRFTFFNFGNDQLQAMKWTIFYKPSHVMVNFEGQFLLWVKNIQYRLMIRLLGKLPWLLYNAKMSGVRAPKSNSVESAPIPPIMKNEHIQTSVKLEASLRHTTQDRKLVRVRILCAGESRRSVCMYITCLWPVGCGSKKSHLLPIRSKSITTQYKINQVLFMYRLMQP